ncbi:hypothetical protein [Kribbella sp. DT2]|uniref:hypothetical protein n=1 Tax=Kribbella sp. DT2 TaxID=3393427 RepID=UPI003CF8B3F7
MTPNFHQAVVRYGDRTVAVVCSRDTGVLAIAEPRGVDFSGGFRESGPLTFLDHAELADALRKLTGARVLTRSALGGPFEVADWPAVSADDVAYWQPSTLGELLFNYWD